MEDEELQEEKQEREKSSDRLRTIERSQLRRAQARVDSNGRRVPRQRQEQPAGKRVVRGRPKKQRRGSRGSKKTLVFFMLIVVAVLFLLTTVFSTARIDLTLSSIDLELPIDGMFTAIREPAQSKDISYRRLPPFEEIREASISDVTRERQSTRAEGIVVVYNVNPSGEDLDLINRTRFVSEDDRQWRFVGKQTIPGGKTKGGVFVPGSKEVKVEGDSVGSKYNLLEVGTRLTAPGLAPYREFADTHAITKTKIVGGFSGERFIPDATEEANARQRIRRDIEKVLRDSLAQSIANNSLSERVVFDGGVSVKFESLENKQNNDAVLIREKGTLYAISFRQAELASLLVKYTPSSAQLALPTRVEVKDLSMEIGKSDDFDVVSSTEFSFRLSGTAKLFWDVDEALFLSDIAGKTRSEVKDIIAREYSQVEKINSFTIFPAWRTSLPGNRNKIQVTVGY